MTSDEQPVRSTAAIPAVLKEHLEQLQMLWDQRQHALYDPDYLRDDVAQLDTRLEAHVDGLLVADEAAQALLEEALSGDEPAGVFAAAYVLLRRNQQAAADAVLAAFREAEAERLDALRLALCYGPIEMIVEALQQLTTARPSTIAAAALEALVHHRELDQASPLLAPHYADEDPTVRMAAWRITAMLEDAAD